MVSQETYLVKCEYIFWALSYLCIIITTIYCLLTFQVEIQISCMP